MAQPEGLFRGAALAGDRLRGAAGRAARIGRMTGQDVAELAAVFAQVARRQARDARNELGRRLGR